MASASSHPSSPASNARLHRWLLNVWLSRGPAAWALRPVAAAYGFLMRLRQLAYRLHWFKSTRLPVRVIVVGNVVAGGAGKTPVTQALVEHLKQRQWSVGIVSRGHGRQNQDILAVQAHSLAQDVGDEPLLLARNTGVPVFVGTQRSEAAQALLAQHPHTHIIICDDGLQHLALERDLEVLVMDERGIGNGWLLPAGPLREPWPRKADLMLYSGSCPVATAAPSFAMTRRLAAYALNAAGEQTPLQTLQNQPVHALAGIAKPETFFNMLRHQGLQLAHTQAWPDHADFSNWQPPADGTVVLCTEKDAVKLWPQHPQVLAVPLQLDLPLAFTETLDQWLTPRSASEPL